MSDEQSLKYPSQKEIKSKLNLFKAEFTRYFIERLNIIGSQAKGLLPEKEGEASGKVMSGMSWVREGVASVPLVGGFIALGLKAPEDLITKKLIEHQKAKAERVNEKVQGMGDEWMKEILNITAQELSRIYEYQIGMLADEDNVLKFAEAAVDTAIHHYAIKKHDGSHFDVETLLKAVMSGEKTPPMTSAIKSKVLPGSESKDDNSLETCISGLTWKIPSVFTKPGIRKKEAGKNKFKCVDFEGSNPSKYGYRGELKERELDDKGGYEDFSDRLKTHVSKEIEDDKEALYQFHQRYNRRTIYVLADEEDVNNYAEYLKEFREESHGDDEEEESKEKEKSFNQFLSAEYGRGVKAVYRGKALTKKRDWSNADFSETDFSGITIKNVTAKNANFMNCRFAYTKFENVNFTKANLKNTKMNFAEFEGKTSLEGVNINAADFSFSQADKNINFSQVTQHISAKFQYSNFYTIENDKVDSHQQEGGLRFIAVAEGADISEFTGKLVQIAADSKIVQGATEQDVENINKIHKKALENLKKDGGTTFIGFAAKSKPKGNSTIEQIAIKGEVTANPYLQPQASSSTPSTSALINNNGLRAEEEKKKRRKEEKKKVKEVRRESDDEDEKDESEESLKPRNIVSRSLQRNAYLDLDNDVDRLAVSQWEFPGFFNQPRITSSHYNPSLSQAHFSEEPFNGFFEKVKNNQRIYNGFWDDLKNLDFKEYFVMEYKKMNSNEKKLLEEKIKDNSELKEIFDEFIKDESKIQSSKITL